MRTLKHAILALAILFSVFASAKTNAPCYTLAGTETVTLPSSVTPVLNLSVCTQYNMTYNLTYSGIAGLLSDNLTFNLPLGITASSLSSFSGSGVTANFVSGGANPVVSVSGWQAGSTLTLVLSVSSPSCGAVAPLNVVTKISGGSNNCAPFSVSNSLTIPVPNLFVTNTASNVLDKNIGDVDEIVFQIANSSNNGANIPQININYTNDPNTTPLGNYYISNSPAKQPGNNMYTYVPATASTGIYVPSTGGTSVVMDHTIFGYFFSGATTLADGNSLYLHIPYKVTGCTSPNTGANYTFSWGCGSAPCSSIPLVTTVNVEVGDPQMRVTSYQNNTNASYCSAASGSSYQFGFEYTNMGTSISGAPAGNAMATGIKLYPFSTTTMGAVDPTSLYFSDGAHTPIAIPQSIITPVTTGTGLGYTTYEINFGALTPAMMMNLWNPLGPNSLADLDGDGFIDDMAEGSTLLITGNFIYNQNTTPFDGACTGLSNYFAPAISSKYQNQCQSIPATDIRVENYPWENAAYYLYQISRRSSSMTAPSDVIAGTPFKVNICPIYYEDWFPLGFDFNCPHGYHDIHIPLPSGFHFDHTGLVSDGGSGWLMSAVTPTDPGCSGPPATIIPDAIETPEDLSTCTPGYLDIKLGRIPFGSCSGVASQTYELPCMDIPLVDNCSGGTTCGTNFGPDILTFTLEYICDPGCSSSVSTLACGNTETYHHCGGRCDSYFGTDNPVSFKRVNLGALNPPTYYGCTSNLPVPLTTTTSPAIDVSAGYPGDVIEVQATGTFNGSPSSTMDVNSGASYTDMYLQIQYDALPAGTIPSAYQPLGIFDFDNTQGNVKVFDGTTLVASVPASAITITPSQVSGVNLLNLNFSAALTNMTSSTITYTLVTDLYLIIKASPPISGTTTFFASGFFPLVNLRMQYAGTETPNTLTPNKVDGSCDSYGAPFTIEQPGDSKSYDFAAENSCDLYYANFEVESSSAKWGTLADDFPNEYRPYAGLDPALSINIPPGYMLVNATYRTIRTPIGTAPNNFDTQGSYQFVSYPVTLPPSQPPIGTPATGITIFFNGIDGQGACWPGLDDKNATWKPIAGIQLELQPLCTALPSDHFAFSGSYTEGLQQSNALYQHTTSFSGPIGPTIHHVNPLLSLNGPVGTINAYTNTVSFNFQYCNTGTIGANNAWVAFENNPAFNALDLSTATVQTVPGGVTLASNVYVDGAGHQSLLVNTGSLPVSTCLNFVLTASINANGCVATGTPPVQDFVSVIYGNECTGAITSPDPSCEVGTTTFTYDRYPSNLELLETSFPSGPVDLCDGTLNYNLVINSSDLGSVSDPSFWLDLPPGISVQSASFTLGCSGTLHTYTSTSVDGNHFGPGGNMPGWNLNTDLSLTTTGLTGTHTAPSNQICVAMTLTTGCAYDATDYISFYAGGISSCTQTLVTPAVQNRPAINNATPADNMSVQVQMTTTNGKPGLDCSNTGTVTVTLTNNGTIANTHTDQVTVTIPAAPVTASNYGSAVAGSNSLTWTIPANSLVPSATQTFTFNLGLNGVLSCQHNLPVTAVIGYNETVSCTSTGGSCAIAYTSSPVSISIDACCQCNMTASTSATNVLCNGGNTGTATVSIAGGAAPLSYLWSNGQTSATATGLTAGTYSVTVTDANACTITTSVTVTQPLVLTASITTVNNVSCNAGANGSAMVTVAGGTGAYSYTWSPAGGNAATASNLAAGSYSVAVNDANGCMANAVVVITQPDPLTNDGSIIVPACGKSATGSITLILQGGTPSYSYSWNTGATTSSITNLTPGVYTVTVTDANGCIRTAHITVPSIAGPILTIVATPSPQLCAGDPVTLCASGISGTYSWNVGQTGSCITVNPTVPTTYLVQETDNNGCSSAHQITITPPPPITIAITATNASCYGGTGSATANVTGGTGAYTYSWSPSGGNAATATNLASGIYTLYVTDANHCTASTPVTINQPPPITVIITSVTPVTCASVPTGSATATVSGGAGSYSYSWSPTGGNALTASHLAEGTYTLFVKDVNGCVGSAVVIIQGPAPLIVSATPTPACGRSISGSVIATVSGGTASYGYSWSVSNPPSNTANTSTISGLAHGTYSIIVTDAHGCTATASAFVGNVTPPTITVSASSVSICPGTSVTLTASGATSYSWSASSITANTLVVNPTTTTTYTVAGIANGTCEGTPVTVTVTVKPSVPICILPSYTICEGQSITLDANATCGTRGAYYIWNPTTAMLPSSGFGASVVVNPSVTTTYTVTGQGLFGLCPSSATTTVNVTPLPIVTVSATPSTICEGQSSTLTALGATTYSWSTGTSNASSIVVSPTATNTYTVTGTVGLCASLPEPVTVNVNPVPIKCLASEVPTCPGKQVHINAGCIPPQLGVTYHWTPASGIIGSLNGPNITASPVTATYTCTSYFTPACPVTQTVTVVEIIPASFAILGPTSTICGGTYTYSINYPSLPPPVLYTWHSTNPVVSGSGTSANITINAPGSNITWDVVDPNGDCKMSVTMPVACKKIRGEDGTEIEPDNTTGISVAVFPNPTDAALNVHITSDQKQEVNLCLYNNMGQLIHCEVLKGELSSIPTSTYPVGIYYYYITAKDGSLLKADKVVITH